MVLLFTGLNAETTTPTPATAGNATCDSNTNQNLVPEPQRKLHSRGRLAKARGIMPDHMQPGIPPSLFENPAGLEITTSQKESIMQSQTSTGKIAATHIERHEGMHESDLWSNSTGISESDTTNWGQKFAVAFGDLDVFREWEHTRGKSGDNPPELVAMDLDTASAERQKSRQGPKIKRYTQKAGRNIAYFCGLLQKRTTITFEFQRQNSDEKSMKFQTDPDSTLAQIVEFADLWRDIPGADSSGMSEDQEKVKGGKWFQVKLKPIHLSSQDVFAYAWHTFDLDSSILKWHDYLRITGRFRGELYEKGNPNPEDSGCAVRCEGPYILKPTFCLKYERRNQSDYSISPPREDCFRADIYYDAGEPCP
eukprot:gnl/MRDRNA2_/MRDRNA2_98211_c0_seq1.p1 gnl/MRDRNA2_/MRDRNA2_98211_c0~~gnl/MRDRNA2_/MRDRNA2_98211_c0_seq1.p1  ORF type:complete len:411 (+),score=73.84 gnl/MRDRNA2_/MRDRNA2_98211_c0_seq1:138-1235(+)